MCNCFENSTEVVDQEFSDENENQSRKLPIVFSKKYSVKFCGFQKLHPFDAAKGWHIVKHLIRAKFIGDRSLYEPDEISTEELENVHTKSYIKSLKCSLTVAKIAEIPLLLFVPNYYVQRGYLRPMRFQTGGSIQAGHLALEHGWSINLGGGFHHCCANRGGGFCPYADVTLLVKTVLNAKAGIDRVMIVDLDAHQGNGHERDFMGVKSVFILDMYNYRIYPRDNPAKVAIRCAVELKPFTEDTEYLTKLRQNLYRSLVKFQPNFIVYNAGTDVLAGDPLGLLSISPDGVIERDEIVFGAAIERHIPIVMLLSGGYLRSSAKVIADSMINLNEKGLMPTRI